MIFTSTDKKRSQKIKAIKEIHFFDRLCDFCGCCVAVCPVDCIALEEIHLRIDFQLCSYCGNCISACPVGALCGE